MKIRTIRRTNRQQKKLEMKEETLSDISVRSSETISKRDKRTATLKVDFLVLMLLTMGLTVFQFDRMNLASALTGGFKEETKVTQYEINIGNELMFLGIFLFEIPSNIVLMKVGPRIWLPLQVILFGFIAIMQIFVKNKSEFYATRFILGFAESGYIPGGSYVVSAWYVEVYFSFDFFLLAEILTLLGTPKVRELRGHLYISLECLAVML